MLSNRHVIDMIPGYALDCLNEEERRQVAEHLAQCTNCQAELDSYRRIVDELYLAVPEAEPPADLKQKILQEVQQIRPADKSTVTMPAWQRFWNRMKVAAPVWAYASFMLVIFLAASNLWMFQRVKRLEMNTPAEFRTVTLAGTDKAPNASGLLVMSQDGNLGTLVVENLPILDASHQYQLWLIKDSKRTSGGVFSVSKDGYGALTIISEQPLKVFTGFGITIEPTGGSPAPTGDKVMGRG
jgi:anti-sigma-K factor RskA